MQRAVSLPADTAIASAIEIGASRDRVQLFPYGTWRGRNGLGPYSLDGKAHAEAVIATTMRAQGPVDLVFDYDHQTALAPGAAGTAIASGWIKSLEADDEGLWAIVEWTAAASAKLDAREYRYASPYFNHDKQGRVTRILTAALTNTPNFNLRAVAASALSGGEMNELEAIAAALGLPASTTLDQLVAAITTLKAEAATLPATASALGLSADTAGTAIASAAAALKARADAGPNPKAFVPVAQLEAVNNQLVRINGERAEAAVASAIQAGKLAPTLKDWGLSYFKQDEAAFASWVSAAPQLLTAGGTVGGTPDPKGDTLTDDERAVASSMGLTEAQFLVARKEGL